MRAIHHAIRPHGGLLHFPACSRQRKRADFLDAAFEEYPGQLATGFPGCDHIVDNKNVFGGDTPSNPKR